MKTVALKSIGCRTNQEEISTLGSLLCMKGFELVTECSDADIIIINTCSVTAGTEAKAIRMIRSFARSAPGARILVTGCLAQQHPQLLNQLKGVDWVVGNAHKDTIPQILVNQTPQICSTDIDTDSPVSLLYNVRKDSGVESRTRFAVKIQEGCDFSCSYCIVASLRGPSRSVERSVIFDICKKALDHGFKELVLTGTHIGQYKSGNQYRLIDLLRQLADLPYDFRVRLSSLDPRDCSEELLQCVITQRRICKHLHLSVQSLDPEVLVAMRRAHAFDDGFVQRIVSLGACGEYVGLGGDFIVGFPGETEQQFEQTLRSVKSMGFNYGHVFRYSIRPGTKAATMPDQISEKEKTARSESLRRELAVLRQNFIERQLNTRTNTVIVEHERPVSGITSNYIRIKIPGTTAPRNSWQDVLLRSFNAAANYCEAELLHRGGNYNVTV